MKLFVLGRLAVPKTFEITKNPNIMNTVVTEIITKRIHFRIVLCNRYERLYAITGY